ncbi:MAG: ABC transporter permease [Myxococcales bacterium]|nr:ABC transporter permease [Myxococcales bacterium]MDH5307794.1 ABC transporter permease [Myxococcales bacterium]MDH5566956.1 ABC transporter permease [Myxococcales bacterium]
MPLASRLGCFVRSAVRGIAASPVTSAVAVATIAITLVLVGAFALLVSNMEALLDEFGDALHVTAFLEEGLTDAARRELANVAGTVEGVESVRLVDKQEALERFRRGVGRGAALLEGLSENPLPASLEITLHPARRSAAGLDVVVHSLSGLPGIADLASGQDWVEGYLRAVALIRGIGVGLGAILALATLLIVANTIRLAVLSRRDEIEILSLVGASRAFVNAPFLIEGVLQGAAGGALAALLLFLMFRLVLPGFEFGLELVLGGLAPRFFSPLETLGLVAAGAGLGLVGSGAALAAESRA